MAKKSMIAKNKRPAKFSISFILVVNMWTSTLFSSSLNFAVFASVKHLTKDKSQVSPKHLGNI